MNEIQESKQLLAKELLTSLYWFDKILLGYDLYPHVHLELCEHIDNRFFEKREDIGKDNKLILMPRNSYKTSVVTIGLPIKTLCIDPNARILLVNEVLDNSIKYLGEIAGHLETNKTLIDFYGDFRGKNWTQEEIIIAQRTRKRKEPSISTAGLGINKVGMHYDLIILDDLVSFNNTGTPEQIQKVIDYYKYMLSILDPNGTMIIIGTRYHFMDLYQHIIDKEEDFFSVFLRKAILEDDTLFFPEVLSWKFLNHRRVAQGSYIFSCQYQNEPIDDEHATFHKEWIKYYDDEAITLEFKASLNTYLHIDPARSQLASGDSTGLIVSGVDANDDVYVLEAQQLRLTEKQFIDTAINYAKRYAVKAILLETNVFQSTMKYLLEEEMKRQEIHFRVEKVERTWQQNKQDMIRMLQPRFELNSIDDRIGGQIFISKTMRILEDQLIRFPKGQHEDVLDSLSFGVRFWKPSTVQEEEKQEEGGTLEYFENKYRQSHNANKYYGYKKQEEKVGFYVKQNN
jgi:hypothetical protein